MSHSAGSDDDRSTRVGRSSPESPEAVQYEFQGTQVVVAQGAYDPASITPLAVALRSVAEKHPRVVVDTVAVTFADSTFLNLLIGIHRTIDLRILAPPTQLRRLLELTGTDRVFKVYANLEDAVA
ncbi:STAS domain-containing protein [Streptomyces sp900105755]|uniref:STAS domain-containing protein n=1 Tax=unclassified Streptomyces TaxID=2593676 RepID=UPI00089A9F9B|nr:STAS domain-containing protein [Streptomyces sp. Ag109_O5-10]SEE93895.1 anti-anti-sigma factor [Streptomyces sp. Ag109_O5-10]